MLFYPSRPIYYEIITLVCCNPFFMIILIHLFLLNTIRVKWTWDGGQNNQNDPGQMGIREK